MKKKKQVPNWLAILLFTVAAFAIYGIQNWYNPNRFECITNNWCIDATNNWFGITLVDTLGWLIIIATIALTYRLIGWLASIGYFWHFVAGMLLTLAGMTITVLVGITDQFSTAQLITLSIVSGFLIMIAIIMIINIVRNRKRSDPTNNSLNSSI
ncbi:MAG: hypothetical protein Q8P90_03005 [bacterium]|nr:hypothetical protein [bacterium]